jgi:hypothetical protein
MMRKRRYTVDAHAMQGQGLPNEIRPNRLATDYTDNTDEKLRGDAAT